MKVVEYILIFLVLAMFVGCGSEEIYEYQLVIDGEYELSDDITIEPVCEGVLNISHRFPWDANSLVIEMMNSNIVLIDTPYTNESTEELIEWIESIVGSEREIYVINTGYHFDNLGGNGYLNERGYTIYGTSKTVEMITDNGEEARDIFLNWLLKPEDERFNSVYKKLEYIEPNQVITIGYDEEKVIDFDGEEIVIYYPGESHSPDNVVVYIPDKAVLFGGCMVKAASASSLGNVADANMVEWQNSIEKLKYKYNVENVDFVIPGHGETGDIELLDKTLDLFE